MLIIIASYTANLAAGLCRFVLALPPFMAALLPFVDAMPPFMVVLLPFWVVSCRL